ncbi:MAG: 2Fe-2S iron-sulfur cluster-binding protein [Thermoanaerobaculia bacterium]|jgi:ferredoxin-NADP reductase
MDGTWLLTLLSAPAGGQVLALVTTLHCAMAVLLRHRSKGTAGSTAIVGPSLAFVASPWILPAAGWLIAALPAHLAWLVACEKLLRRPGTRPEALPSRPAAPRPVAVTPPHAAAKPVAARDFVPMRVLAVLVETPEIRTFRIARPAAFEFVPGQFAMLRVDVDGRPLVRCYSISSSPSVRGYFEISVRRQGQVSGFLHATVQPGASLEVRGPQGSFVYPEGKRPVVLLAAGIGITPLLSMLRHALESEPQRPVTLLLSAKTEAQVPFLRELRLLAGRHPSFRLAIALSQSPSLDGYYPGRIDGSLIETVAGDVRESVCLICGPLPMIDDTVRTLAGLGVPRERIRFEKFEAATASAKSLASETSRAVSGEPVCLKLRKRGKVVTVAEGQSILDAIESAGEELPSFCRAGVCGTCRTRIVDGEVEGEFDAIGEEDRANGFVLACVARPMTSCVLDA